MFIFILERLKNNGIFIDMKIKELDSAINEILEQEAKKLIKEQINDVDHLIDSVKSFQSLSGLLDKVTEIEDAGIDDPVIFINVQNITPEELVDCCGGTSFQEALKNLMQGIHHDLEDNQVGNDMDVDIDAQGDENSLNLAIRISANKDKTLGDIDMKENTNESKKDTNPTVDKKKDIILGSKDICSECGKKLTEENAGGVCDECKGKKEEIDEKAIKKWIQKAINPKHKGYCTPMTKKTCTPRRKALAKRFKKGIENNESTMKKVITLSEAEMAELLRKIIIEAAGKNMDATTEKAIKDSGTQNNDALRAVEKKIKDYLAFKGNDNPEFPNQIGQGEEKAARQNTEDQDEIVNDNRGRGPQDLDYDSDFIDNNGEPPKKFKERLKMSLIGDPKMGNSQDAVGVIKTKTGENMVKNIERRQKNLRKEPIYPKEAVPVKTKGENEPNRPVNEEIKRMKQMASYNKKTQ